MRSSKFIFLLLHAAGQKADTTCKRIVSLQIRVDFRSALMNRLLEEENPLLVAVWIHAT
jgi:hypothetical protein